MTDSRQAWLESLDPRVRAEVEAEIADYEDPDNAEYMDDEWQPSPNATFKVVPDRPAGVWFDLEFSASEYETLMEAVGEADPFSFIKAAALERAMAQIAAKRSPAADSINAAD